MKESVEMLLKADDQYSQEFAAAANSMDKFTAAAGRSAQGAGKVGQSFGNMGGEIKATTQLIVHFASAAGGPDLANVANQIGAVTDKVTQLKNAAGASQGRVSALNLGLVGLAGSLGFMAGKAIGESIFQTKEFEKALEAAKVSAVELNAQIAKMNSQRAADRREDIELIRNPEEKRTAYEALLSELNANIAGVTSQVEQSKKEVEEWNRAWKISGNDYAYAEMAQENLKTDQERLAALKEQRDEIAKVLSARTKEHELIRAANAAKDRSESYIETLKQEIEYLAATRDEQIKLDAARNATTEDRGEAERLLRERDAILAKAEAEKQLAADRQRAIDEQAKAQADAQKAAEREIQRVESLKQAEWQRLELQRIEIEQGKEMARIRELELQGVDTASAKQLAAEEAKLEKLREQQRQKDKDKDLKLPVPKQDQDLNAKEGRLLTRGPAAKVDPQLALIAELLKKQKDATKDVEEKTEEKIDELIKALKTTIKLVMVQ